MCVGKEIMLNLVWGEFDVRESDVWGLIRGGVSGDLEGKGA